MHICAVLHMRPSVQVLDGGMKPFNALVKVGFGVFLYLRINQSLF